MSGVKRATVSQSLNGTIDMVHTALQESAETAQSFQRIGRGEFDGKKRRVDNIRKNLHRVFPSDLKSFLEDADIKKWQSLLKEHDDTYKRSTDFFAEAESKDSNYSQRKTSYNTEISNIKKEAENIKRELEGKEHYCDSENAKAMQLKARAQQILSQIRSDNSLVSEAKSLRQQSFVTLSLSEDSARLAEKEYDRLVGIAKDRQEKKRRITEEKKRNALNLVDELQSLRKDIESKDFKKFAKGKYSSSSVGNRIDSVIDSISKEDYDYAINAGKKLKTDLKNIADCIDAAQQVWVTAKTRAEKAFADAQAEIALINKADLKKYSGINFIEIDKMFAVIEKASNKIAVERFDEALQDINSGMKKISEVNEVAIKNKELWETRIAIAESIIDALKESKYDEPCSYLENENDELSDLGIVAATPNGVGDMTLMIKLTGEVSFEVANIDKGREQLCINSVRDMQARLFENGISFDVTDWGNAENQNQVRLDVKHKEQQIQQIKQRQG